MIEIVPDNYYILDSYENENDRLERRYRRLESEEESEDDEE